MCRQIRIEGFGPVEKTTIDLDKNMYIFVGSQASGKSTISKVIYYCLNFKDYLSEYLTNTDFLFKSHPNEYFTNFLKYLTNKFIQTFGTTKHVGRFVISYYFGDESIIITLNDDGYVKIVFSKDLRLSVIRIIDHYADSFLKLKDFAFDSFINASSVLIQKMASDIQEVFEDDREIIYIPAGRILLSTLSERLHTVSVKEMDLTMQDFINLIDNTKRKFGSKIPDMIENYLKTVKGQIKNEDVRKASELVKKVLKADYVSGSDGERIYYDEKNWIKLMFGSSGQQESLWILLLLFTLILENRKAFIIIEEPEAHLFPMAQKYVMELIALCSNSTGSSIIVTTHSPYILTSANVLLFSHRVESSKKTGNFVIPKNFRLNYDSFCAYSLENSLDGFKMNSICDDETSMIDTAFIDSVSDIINNELERLLMLEASDDMQ